MVVVTTTRKASRPLRVVASRTAAPAKDEAAEREVVGLALVNPRAAEVAAALPSEAFTSLRLRTVAGAIRRLHGRGAPVAERSVLADLADAGELASLAGSGRADLFVLELVEQAGNPAAALHYAERLLELLARREALRELEALRAAVEAGGASGLPESLRRTAERLERRSPGPGGPAAPRPIAGSGRYSWTPAGVFRGDERVLDWAPIVEEVLVVPDDAGRVTGQHYRLRVGADEATVPRADVLSGEAWGRFPSASGTGTKGVRDVLANVVLEQASALERTRVSDRLGWHHVPDDGIAYVRADASTVPEGAAVRLVGMPDRLARAAAAPAGDDGDVRGALSLVRAVSASRATLVALGAGARSLGYSIEPAPTGLVLVGRTGAGKTGTAALARSLVFRPSWPPEPTASFADTPTSIELAIAREADVPVLVDDLALAPDAPEVEVREAKAKLERILRPAGNRTAMRRRATRDLTEAPGNEVRSVPILTAETLPPTIAPSLLRRAVVLELEPGDVETRRLRDEAEGAGLGLRAIGDRIVAGIAETGREAAAAMLRELDRKWAIRVEEALARIAPDRDSMSDSLSAGAGCLLAGLELVAVAAGLEPEELAAEALEPLAQALARQAERIRARHEGSADLAEAAGQVVREALLERRAHVRGSDGDPACCVPGETEQAHGLRRIVRDGVSSWEAQGPACYYLSDRGGLGVRTGELHALIRRSHDRRLEGYTPRALVPALLRAGALVPSSQKGRAASQMVRVGEENLRLVTLRLELVFPGSDPEDPAPGERQHPTSESDGGAYVQRTATTATRATAQVDGSENGNRAGRVLPFSDALTSDVADVAVVAVPGDQGPIDDGETLRTYAARVLELAGWPLAPDGAIAGTEAAWRAAIAHAPEARLLALVEFAEAAADALEAAPGSDSDGEAEPLSMPADGPERAQDGPSGSPSSARTSERPAGSQGSDDEPAGDAETLAAAIRGRFAGEPSRDPAVLVGVGVRTGARDPEVVGEALEVLGADPLPDGAAVAALVGAELERQAVAVPAAPAGDHAPARRKDPRSGKAAHSGRALPAAEVAAALAAPGGSVRPRTSGAERSRARPGRGSSWKPPGPFGVLGSDGLLMPDGSLAPVPVPGSSEDVLAIARAAGLPRVFVHESALEAFGAGIMPADRYGRPEPFVDAPDVHVLAPGLASGRIFAGAPGPIDLAASIAAAETALSFEFRHGPGRTGELLLVACHERDVRGIRLDRPRPAAEGIPRDEFPPAARQFRWTCEPGAVPPGDYLHGFDKARMFLAAASGLVVGWGAVEELDGIAFDPKLPAWWECRLDPVPDLPPELFAGAWHSTAMVQLAREDLGQDVRPARALTWEHSGAYFGTTGRSGYGFARRVSDALDACASDELARGAVKRLYTALLGGRLLSDDGPLGAVPDWSGLLVSRANANLVRNVLAARAAGGPAPIAIDVDTLVYASDEPQPARALPSGLKPGDRAGQFRPIGTGAVVAHPEVREALEARSAVRLVELVKRGAGR